MSDVPLKAFYRKAKRCWRLLAPDGDLRDLERALDERGHDSVVEWLEEIENSQGGGVNVDTASREAMVDIHVTLQDRKAGRDVDGNTKERAAVLFRQFIRDMDPDHSMTGVEYSNGRYKMMTKRAEEVLASENLLISNPSVAIGRAMDAVEENSEWQGETMFRHESKNGHSLSVHGETWESYLTEISSAAGHEVDVAHTDDPGNSGEGAVEIEEVESELDRLASHSANTVVSGSDDSVLAVNSEGGSDD